MTVAGATTNVLAEVDTGRAIYVVPRSPSAGVLGSYSTAQVSGTIAAGTVTSLGKLAAFRFAPTVTTNLAVIRRIRVSMGELTAFAAGFASMQLFFGRASTVAPVTGSTAGTITGNNTKLRTSHATTQGGTLYVATTALISGDTVTLDTNPLAVVATSVVATSGAPVWPAPVDLWYTGAGDHPIVLANQEAIYLQMIAPATGTMSLGVHVQWDEVASY
jgi:hypothetical protein